ncbi:DUF3124 domain-containing protein [Cochleicola gelatinilyticus]|uniref:DUF3124 domain-containing protein n=1 Tax=Cochleicola gelatinilyticus TaxID=1763537 RepID=A0A167EXP2_9FLAO|nr:DUF3124 domain-containing protein [Cochleicola gelatinilyticus]OAB75981.1 hypothetical protein ULVI_13010 [Cochleicola gelatinilyticus]
MKPTLFFLIFLTLLACDNPVKEINTTVDNHIPPENNWTQRAAAKALADSVKVTGATYLPVYSEIYQRNKDYTYNLTATVSIRNISLTDTIYLHKADYYDTHGEKIRSYFNKKVYVKPMETIEIVVNEDDKKGGTGANFIFEWSKENGALDPFFEAVMISTSGQQGISFTTQGIMKWRELKGRKIQD